MVGPAGASLPNVFDANVRHQCTSIKGYRSGRSAALLACSLCSWLRARRQRWRGGRASAGASMTRSVQKRRGIRRGPRS
eukprot:6181856-Pleurochrysis_carterae.AAC.4